MTLNEHQIRAVTTTCSRVLVLAGPGSGKTRVIVERVARLITELHFSGSDILLLTFTRKAAAEMRDRLTQRVGEAHVRRMTIGTFHGVCFSILKQYGELLGYRPATLTVFDDTDQRDMLNDIIDGRGAKINKGAMEQLLQDFGTRGWSVLKQAETEHPQEAKVFAEYRTRLRECNAVDFGLILADVERLMTQHPHVREALRAKWRHILIDEYQDTDHLQFNLHEIIDPENLFAVGDSDQAIYSFRGATLDVLLDFSTSHFAGEVIELPTCYRCATRIVDTANRLIAHNENRIAKSIEAARDYTGQAFSDDVRDVEIEANEIAACCFTGVHNDNTTAVLSRTKRYLEPIAAELDRLGVKYTFVGRDGDWLSRDYVRQFISFLTLVHNPHDNLAFMRIRAMIGMSADAYAAARVKAASDELSHLQAVEAMTGKPLFGKDRREANGDSLKAWAGELVAKFASHAMELLDHTNAWAINHSSDSLADYLAWIKQRDMQDDLTEQPCERVVLMTIHAAKGLEFDSVIVAGCHEGHLPHSRSKTPADIEEERRLMYVAITRSKDGLVLSHAQSVPDWNGRPHPVAPSRFIAELFEDKQ